MGTLKEAPLLTKFLHSRPPRCAKLWAMKYARIQDARFLLPGDSTNWRSEEDEAFIDLFNEKGNKLPKTMGGLSVFCDLRWACRDLLGQCSADYEHPCYSREILKTGGSPVLVLIDGEYIADDLGAACVIDPDLESERRFTPEGVWDMILEILAITFPEEEDMLLSWERSPVGFRRLWNEYQLDGPEALEMLWPLIEERLMLYSHPFHLLRR